ncbi:acetyltransferase [Paraburkholderia ginsengiterrae]|uniref:Acetyltransferase n=1 Tax=Paraburkholderia ginsengiterrae TaxID=1462993 RepID=A0A1A9NEQ5_9BURK|nr:GNAT family protein [Paraburkholderia ginsengiterrae]OAJ54030.1 acetyltransferase [Paraburkholderia ginsengiterrae]OAJ64628.1 acetyltransferase [Paraburkholderia ginsengiterrae]
MESRRNVYDQPIGTPVPGWSGAQAPGREPLSGRYCRIEPVNVERHAEELYDAYSSADDGRSWTYLAVGPFESLAAYREHLTRIAASADPLHYTVIDLATGKAVGTLALMRIDRTNGVIEVGHVTYSPRLQRTRVATEAMFLLMTEVFEKLGYRRFEWKCDSLNEPSRTAALRYGFTFEGIFRQAIVYRERNRDTAWFSIIDSEWPALRSSYTRWLDAGNFDAQGQQVERLVVLIDQQRAAASNAAR